MMQCRTQPYLTLLHISHHNIQPTIYKLYCGHYCVDLVVPVPVPEYDIRPNSDSGNHFLNIKMKKKPNLLKI